MNPTIAIILVNYNGKADTLECLISLRMDRYPHKQIIVVDNGSSDDSVAALCAAFPEITVLKNGRNLGFTGGNNAGILYALAQNPRPKYLYLLNNDTTVDPDSTNHLIEALESDPQCGVAAPVMHYFDRKDVAWFAGSTLDLTHGLALHDNSAPPAESDPPRELPWITGCAMLFRADVLKNLAGFDDRFFLYWEDVDLSLRVRAAGYSLKLVPAARIYHKCGSTSNRTISCFGEYYYLRNNLLLIDKHLPKHKTRAKFRVLATAAKRWAHSNMKWKRSHAAGKAIFDYARHRFGKA